MKNPPRYSNISHRLTCMIAFINVDYIWNSRFWMNFALNKHQKLWFLVCATRGYTFCGMRGYGIISQRMIFQWNTCMTTIWYKIQLITFGVFHPKTTVSDVIRGTFKFDNFYFNKYICSHVKLMFVNVFSLFRNYLPSKKAWPFIWTILNPHHPGMLCTKFCWNLHSDSWEDENVKSLRQRRRSTDKLFCNRHCSTLNRV